MTSWQKVQLTSTQTILWKTLQGQWLKQAKIFPFCLYYYWQNKYSRTSLICVSGDRGKLMCDPQKCKKTRRPLGSWELGGTGSFGRKSRENMKTRKVSTRFHCIFVSWLSPVASCEERCHTAFPEKNTRISNLFPLTSVYGTSLFHSLHCDVPIWSLRDSNIDFLTITY